jgi:hypothetical protein
MRLFPKLKIAVSTISYPSLKSVAFLLIYCIQVFSVHCLTASPQYRSAKKASVLVRQENKESSKKKPFSFFIGNHVSSGVMRTENNSLAVCEAGELFPSTCLNEALFSTTPIPPISFCPNDGARKRYRRFCEFLI